MINVCPSLHTCMNIVLESVVADAPRNEVMAYALQYKKLSQNVVIHVYAIIDFIYYPDSVSNTSMTRL